MPESEKTLLYHPAVFAVGRDYCILFLCRRPALASVVVDGVTYTDNMNGVMRTDTLVHKVPVPGDPLNRTRRYRLHLAPLEDHASYFAKPEPTEAYEYDFTPVPADRPLNIYAMADTHGEVDVPAAAALARPDMDLLILNGDIGDSADSVSQIETLHRLVSNITEGRFPVVYARGNHDTRGRMAEHLGDYIPLRNGRTFYTFRQGPVWGIVLDAGEDKPDGGIEYGGVADYPAFRREQTAYLKSVTANSEQEYSAPGVQYRLAICHMNFAASGKGYAETTPDIYRDWIRLLNGMHIDCMICGHDHCIGDLPHGGYTKDPLPDYPTVLCSARRDHPVPFGEEEHPGGFTGTAFFLKDGHVTRTYTNHLGEVLDI